MIKKTRKGAAGKNRPIQGHVLNTERDGGHSSYVGPSIPLEGVSGIDHLTPVERRDGLWFKRDDLFLPFQDHQALNGGKLRQVIDILQRSNCGGVITAATIHSPQIPLVAGAAQNLRLPCVVVTGGSALTPELQLAQNLGARLVRAASGRHTALFAEVRRLNASLRYQVIPFGSYPFQFLPIRYHCRLIK